MSRVGTRDRIAPVGHSCSLAAHRHRTHILWAATSGVKTRREDGLATVVPGRGSGRPRAGCAWSIFTTSCNALQSVARGQSGLESGAADSAMYWVYYGHNHHVVWSGGPCARESVFNYHLAPFWPSAPASASRLFRTCYCDTVTYMPVELLRLPIHDHDVGIGSDPISSGPPTPDGLSA